MKDWKTKRLVLREGTPSSNEGKAAVRRVFDTHLQETLPPKEGILRVQEEVLPGDPVKRVSVHGKLKVKLFKWTLLVVDIPNLHIDLQRTESKAGLKQKNNELEERLRRLESRGTRRLALPGKKKGSRGR
ncbi:hypothetical protein [Sinobaca sp. H24]|uniref:hypothetical protein n=1 Tax=Sinobaca sp. H24 TaxID=2923376 RepID=UPI00207AC780|nr:hypothetical protein [Sinobaca sp. H24]